MKRKKYIKTATLILLASIGFTSMPVRALVLEYQSPDTSIDKSADCEVYYDTYYDFTTVIPKDRPEDISGITSGSYTGVFDDNFHGIIVGCETPGAVIYYSTDGGKTYTTEKPVYKDAGTYTTYFKVEKGGMIITDFATVKILEAVIDYTSSDYSGLYDGNEHGINISVATDGCEILYSEDGINYSPEKPMYKNSGTYITYYKITKDNYEPVEGSNKVIIGTRIIEYTSNDWIGTYDGEAHRITVDTATEGCEILYSADGINYTSENPAYIKAGTYVTYFKIIKDGYETVEGSNKVVIGSHTIEYTSNDWIGIYDGKAHEITLKVTTEGCEILYSADEINYTSVKPAYAKVGTYATYYKIMKEGYETVEGSNKVIIRNKAANDDADKDTNNAGSSNSSNKGSSGNSPNDSLNNTSSNTAESAASNSTNVQTGDESNILFYGAVLITSLFGVIKVRKSNRKVRK